ncbi:MAG: DUF6261 family protein [Saprospiraceae bacterium]
MIKINSATLGSFRNGEYLQFMKNVMVIYGKYDTKKLKLDHRLAELANATESMNAVFMNVTAHEITPELKLLDTLRGNTIKGIKWFLESQQLRLEPEKIKAASQLLANYKSHGESIERLSYQQETAVMDALLYDWTNMTALMDAIITLDLTDWVNQLITQNREFDQKYLERAETSIPPTQMETKKALIKVAYDELSKDIQSLARVDDNKAIYIEIIEKLNGLISRYKTSANLRIATRRKEKVVITTEVPNMD